MIIFSGFHLTSPAVRAFLRARAASSADLAAELVISNKAASKFRMRSAACSRFFEDDGDDNLEDFLEDAAMAVAERVGDSVAVIFVGWR